MTHLKKRVTFAGVDYILVPERLWQSLQDWVRGPAADGWEGAREVLKECHEYAGTSELKEPDNE